jgi:glycosyltransferase involved in cell wall biosynthesis
MKHVLHVVSLPHTQTTAEWAACAYTQKVRKFGKMLAARGHDVIIYSGEENDAVCAEHVPVVTVEQQRRWFGEVNQDRFYPITWNPGDDHWREMNLRAAQEIRKRAGPRDLVLLIAGWCQKQVADDLPNLIACEWGVGYQGIFSPYCAFESRAWMHHVYGLQKIEDGRWFDAVIPNFFDMEEFPVTRTAVDLSSDRKRDYLLYCGRLVQRKGPHVALMIAGALGLPLVLAGQGVSASGPGWIESDEGFRLEGDLRHVGLVDFERRAALMSGAIATLVPTIYIEPFGGVAVEAMLSGCPVVATDWGAFTETVDPGVTGYRFRTLGQGMAAVDAAAELDRWEVREAATERFALENVAPLYEEWFDRLLSLWGEGWDERVPLRPLT